MSDCKADDQKATGLADRPSAGRNSLCHDTEVERKAGIVSGCRGAKMRQFVGKCGLEHRRDLSKVCTHVDVSQSSIVISTMFVRPPDDESSLRPPHAHSDDIFNASQRTYVMPASRVPQISHTESTKVSMVLRSTVSCPWNG